MSEQATNEAFFIPASQFQRPRRGPRRAPSPPRAPASAPAPATPTAPAPAAAPFMQPLSKTQRPDLPVLDVVDLDVDPCVGVAPEIEVIAERKVFDMRRWMCQVRPQYKYACGISALVSCWNYLYSTLGAGELPPLTVEQALSHLGFQPPFSQIRFGPFTGNATLQLWFQRLCAIHGVGGSCGYLYKPKGRRVTAGVTPNEALRRTTEAVSSPHTALVYHCHNHYATLVGYEATPDRAVLAYGAQPAVAANTWVLMADSSRTSMPIRSLRWKTIVDDLNCEGDAFINVRQLHKGVQSRRALRGLEPEPEAQHETRRATAPTRTPLIADDDAQSSETVSDDLGSDIDYIGGEAEEDLFEDDVFAEQFAASTRTVCPGVVPEAAPQKKKGGNVHCILFFSSDQNFKF